MLNCSYADSTGDGRVSAHMQIFRGVVPKRFYELVIIFATRARPCIHFFTQDARRRGMRFGWSKTIRLQGRLRKTNRH